MGDLISQVVQLTQLRLAQRLAFSEEMQSMVLEVRADSLRVMLFLRKILSYRLLNKKAEDHSRRESPRSFWPLGRDQFTGQKDRGFWGQEWPKTCTLSYGCVT